MKYFLKRRRILFIILLFVIATQGCVRARLNAPSVLPTAQDIEQVAAEEKTEIAPTPTLQVQKTATLTATELAPTETSLPKVILTAIKGNIYIRRGPGLAYNPISVLYKDTSTQIIARDVLSKWVQVILPDSEKTGWVSIQTEYSKIDGELDSLPDFTPTDWPIPAYVRNCTQHDMYIIPGDIVLLSSLSYPENEIWLYPGSYTVLDIFVDGEPEVLEFEIREGLEVEIEKDGLGERRKC